MTRQPKIGKLSPARLERLLNRYGATKGGAILIGPKVGLDAAAVAVNKAVLVLTSDPVTYACDKIGSYAVHINANDLFVSGAQPNWFLANVLLPDGQAQLAEKIFAQMHRVCGELGVLLIGGHTEITPDLPAPIVVGFMVGRATGKKVLTAAGVQVGDVIILTKGVAIEGTAIFFRELEQELRKHFSSAMIRRGQRFLKNPGLSVGPEARIALRHRVHAMHDPTEGGLLNGLWEMSYASGCTLHIDLDRVPVYPETKAVCHHFGIDPLRLLASGALLIACPEQTIKVLTKALSAAGIRACEIGYARKGSSELHFQNGKSMKKSAADEILKVLPANRRGI